MQAERLDLSEHAQLHACIAVFLVVIPLLVLDIGELSRFLQDQLIANLDALPEGY